MFFSVHFHPQTLHDNQRSRHHLYHTSTNPTPIPRNRGRGGGGSSPCRVLPQTLHDNQRSRHHLYHTSTNPTPITRNWGGGGGGGGGHLPAVFFHRHCMIIKDPDPPIPHQHQPYSDPQKPGGGGSSPCRVLPQTLHDNQRSRHHLYHTSTDPTPIPRNRGGGGGGGVISLPRSSTDTA